MKPFLRCKQLMLTINKLLKSEARVKLSELLMFLIFQLGAVAHFIAFALESGVL